MKATRLNLLILAALAGSLAGCGDERPSTTATSAQSAPTTSTTRPAPSQRASDRFIARAALLQLSDFAAGWRIKPDEGEEIRCRTSDRIERNPKAKSAQFELPHAHAVSQEVTVLRSAKAADAAIDVLVERRTLACIAREVETMVRRDVRPGLRIGRLTIARLPTAAIGDRTEGARLTIPVSTGGVSTQVYGDFAFTRVGRAISLVASLSPRLPADKLRMQLAARAAERLGAALAGGRT